MQNSWNQYWLRKKCCLGRSKPWQCPREKLQLRTQVWVLPKCHCSAAASRDWRSDEQVKNNLKNRDKNIPTVWSVASMSPTWSFVLQCLARFGEAAYLLGRMKQKLKKSVCVCVWNTSCKTPWISPFISVLSNDFLSTLLLGWVRKPPLWQELQEWEFFNHIFFPQSRRNHTEWKTPRTHLATGDTQTCILGFEAECYNPLGSFSSPLFWPQVQAVRDELWGWFSWIWKSFPGPDANTSLQGAQHDTSSLCQMMMKGKLQR